MRNYRLVGLAIFIGLESLLFGAEPSLVFDLRDESPAPTVLTRIYGRGMENDGTRGVPVTGGFDCDGDGHLDTAFAQMQGDPFGRVGAGEVTLVFGDGTIGGTIDSAVVQVEILRIAGTQGLETTGDEIWMDDLNGDGTGDLIIGRQNFSPSPDRRGAGALTIIFGGPELRTHAEGLGYLDLANPPEGIGITTLWGASAYDRLGIWMRTGDITGDGVADLLVGADEVDGAGSPVTDNRGAVYVLRGGAYLDAAPETIDLAEFGTGNFPDAFNGNVAQVDPPEQSQDYHFGATVQVADLDGNNRAEILVAAALERSGASLRLPNAPGNTGESFGGSANGSVFIIWDENFPSTQWPNGYRFSADSPPLGEFSRIDGASENEVFGEEMIGGLDYSGDGFADFFVGDLVGSPGDRVAAGIGVVIYTAANLRGESFNISSPPSGIFVSSIYGPEVGAIGADTAAHGDFDGDGIGDLAFGNPHDSQGSRTNAGSVHVLYGQPGGWPGVVDLRPDSEVLPEVFPTPDVVRIAQIRGANGASGSNSGDTLCYSGDAADMNGDGFTDLIINEMVGDGVLVEDVGNLLIISGTALLSKPVYNLASSETGPVNFWIGDINGGADDRRTLTFTNTSNGNLVLTSIELTGPNVDEFSIVNQSPVAVLSPDESTSIELSFSPSSTGYKAAAVAITTNLDPIPFRVGLAGFITGDSIGYERLRFDLSGQDVSLQYNSETNVKYLLQKSSNLSDWITKSVTPGTGSAVDVFDEDAFPENTARLFYRLLAEPKN